MDLPTLVKAELQQGTPFLSMARLWRDQRKQNEARELLAPVWALFTGGLTAQNLRPWYCRR